MCLAVPARIVEGDDVEAVVDLQGNRLQISLALTPEARIGDWVLVHAGFAIARLDEDEARETWEYLQQIEWADRAPGWTGGPGHAATGDPTP